ncbi:MAG: hypothetical protein AABW59_03410 [archaeon]
MPFPRRKPKESSAPGFFPRMMMGRSVLTTMGKPFDHTSSKNNPQQQLDLGKEFSGRQKKPITDSEREASRRGAENAKRFMEQNRQRVRTRRERSYPDYEYSAAKGMVESRLGLLKTNSARALYLEELLKFAKKRENLIVSLSRNVEAGLRKRGASEGAMWFARLPETEKNRLVGRELEAAIKNKLGEVKARISAQSAQKKSSLLVRNIAEKEFVPRKLKGVDHGALLMQRIRSSPEYAGMNNFQKMSYLTNIKRIRSGELTGMEDYRLNQEMGKVKAELQKNSAKKIIVQGKTVSALLEEASLAANPHLRKKILSRAISLSRKQGVAVPAEANYIKKYGKLKSSEIIAIRSFEKAKLDGDYRSAINAIKGTRFKADEGVEYIRLLAKQGTTQKSLGKVMQAIEAAEMMGYEWESKKIRAQYLRPALGELEKEGNYKGAIKLAESMGSTSDIRVIIRNIESRYISVLESQGKRVEAGFFAAERGQAEKAEKIARSLEFVGTKKSVFDAMKIRKRMAKLGLA